MPQKRKAQRAALNREASKRVALEPLPSLDNEAATLEDHSWHPSRDQKVLFSGSEEEAFKWDCGSSSSEECVSFKFDCLSSTVVNEIDVDSVIDGWESGVERSDILNVFDTAAEAVVEHRLAAVESTIEGIPSFEDVWISDLSTVPLLSSGKFFNK